MLRSPSFHELLARVPASRRSDRVRVLLAAFALCGIGDVTLKTSAIANYLQQQLRSKAPRNVSDTLSKLQPFIERVQKPDRMARWRITETGLGRIAELTGIQVERTTQANISLTNLHPRIYKVTQGLFATGHYAEAVGAAAKELNRFVRDRTSRLRDDGVGMMHQVFSETENATARLLLGPIHEDWQRDLQSGLRFMMAGCQSSIANVHKHGDLTVETANACLECLAMLSYLARQVERAQCIAPAGNDANHQIAA